MGRGAPRFDVHRGRTRSSARGRHYVSADAPCDYRQPSPAPWQLGCAGAIVAAITLTKINLGLYTGAALLLAMLAATASQRAFRAIAGVCIVAPLCVMAPALGERWARECCAILTISIGLTALVIARERPFAVMGAARWRALTGAFAVCAAILIAWGVWHGGSLRDMLDSIVLSNARGAHTWTVPLHIGVAGLLSVAASVALLILRARGLSDDRFHWCKLGIGSVALTLILTSQVELAFAFALPFVWCTAGPWPRIALATVTVMLGMNVYPVAASQLRFALVPLAICAALWLNDAIVALRVHRARAVIVAATAVAYAFSLIGSVRTYVTFPALDLAGSAGIHVDSGDRELYRWVANRVSTCDGFVAFPAMHSFYLWTGQVPPVYADVDGWQPYLNADRQAIERRILDRPRSCVVMIDKLVPFWLPAQDTARRTLLGYIRDRFVETDSREGFHILVPRE